MKIRHIFRLLIIMILICIIFTLLKTPMAQADPLDGWWDEDWPYRVPVIVDGNGAASVNLNFTELFDDLGLNDALLDIRSIRVVPYQAGIPEEPLPYEETYSTLFIDAETLDDPDPHWSIEESTELFLDSEKFTQGNASLHAHTVINEGSNSKTGFSYQFGGSEDWSAYEALLYDVWPGVNSSAVDQTTDLYLFTLAGIGNCAVTEFNGPPLAIDMWNSVSVSLKPFGNCETPDLSTLTSLRWFVKVATEAEDHGYFETGDELDLWVDNFRLVNQDGSGEIRWQAQAEVDKYYIYFDTLDHEGHPPPSTTIVGSSTTTSTVGEVEMGGYFHIIQGASTGNLDIWTAPITEYTLYYQQAPIRESPLQIRAARGEFESIQIVVNSQTAQSLPVSVTSLEHEGGTYTIHVENIDLFRVDYVDITKISGYFGRSGPWPDPLYPICLGDSIDFPAGTNQPLWIRVEVPGGTIPGLFTGTIMIGTASIPFSVKVWDFTIPSHPHLESKVGFDWELVLEEYQGTAGGDPQPCYEDLVDAINETFENYRLTPSEANDYAPPEDVELYWLTSYESEIAHSLQTNDGKEVWWQSTHILDPAVLYPQIIDELPLVNPADIDRPGLDSRILPWLAWLDRVDGYYYPQTTHWNETPWDTPFSNGLSNGDGYFFYPPTDTTIAFDPCDPLSNRLVPSIRLELLREGLEDYAYLWLLNNGKPIIGEENQGDLLLQEIVSSRTAFSRVPTSWEALRGEIASLIEERQTHTFLPLLVH